MTQLQLPGLVDVHVHLRQPGGTHKEDFNTGTAAALAGGVVALLDMPNNNPPTTDEKTLARKMQIASAGAHCDFGLYLGATANNARHVATLSGRVAGLKIYASPTYGPLHLTGWPALLTHFTHWPRDKPIAVHAEGLALPAVIALAQAYERMVHLCHVSRQAEIELIRRVKERGGRITCEVTPHHLFLTEADARRLGGYGRVNPPLGTEADRAALWASLDVIDVVASDHAPHTRAEKEGPNPPPGMPGLETTLPLLLTAVAEGRLSLDQLVALTCQNPARIFGLKRDEGTCIEIDPDDRYVLAGSSLRTKCGWTPFEGMTMRGRVVRVYLRGALAYDDGQVLVQPGFGRALF